jgi:pimeloyl-ACP methyl ester carboxylesterase
MSPSPVGDALAVLDAAAVTRPVVVGCSIGGSVAIDLALGIPTGSPGSR